MDAQRAPKRQKLLSDDSASEDESSALPNPNDGGTSAFKINDEFARRFEHNKKREELHRLEEKYGKGTSASSDKANGTNGAGDASDSASSSESEDDEGELATREVDDEIAATLQAIRTKDRKLYDKNNNFYRSLDVLERQGEMGKRKQDKPVYLQDYHRQNLLAGEDGAEDQEPSKISYDREQTALRQSLVNEMNKDESDPDSGAEDTFLTAKSRAEDTTPEQPQAPLEASKADEDPETFLSNFMTSRAWVPEQSSKWQPFESDDEDEIAQADNFEEAYNLRFEDPNKANETLLSHSRQAVAQYSVRREKQNSRKRAREAEKQDKAEAKRQRHEEKSRLKNLKLEMASEKLKQFKEAAGIKDKSMAVDEWQGFLDAGWDSDKWDNEMKQRFGDEYYADPGQDEGGTSKKTKKPKWDDEIDIGDIVPEFDPGDDADFSLSEDDGQAATDRDPEFTGASEVGGDAQRRDQALSKADKKREARKERRKLEELVDKSVAAEMLPVGSSSKGQAGPFRYRDTSPTSFGLNARDILMADDSALNQFAGLKKLAAFREAGRKKKDRKQLGKSARLRQWRKDTFGDETGPSVSFQDYVGSRAANGKPEAAAPDGDPLLDTDIVTAKDKKKKKKKRSRKRKAEETSAD